MRWVHSGWGFASLLFSVGLIGFILGVLVTSAANEFGDSTEAPVVSISPTPVLPTPAPTPTRVPTKVVATPTTVPERVWTVEELAECTPPPREGQMTDCQVELMTWWLEDSPEELSRTDQAILAEHQQRFEQVDDALRSVFSDGEVTALETDFLCSSPLAQYHQWLVSAREFARQVGLKGHEVDYLRVQQSVSQVYSACQ